MMNMSKEYGPGAFEDDFIGVFDSGVGGISVLKKLVQYLPNEDFLYYGDSANAPYGEKTEDQVAELSTDLAGRMIDRGAKAIVIACNTATSAAAAIIRDRYKDIPIVGIEPAIKPAAMELSHKKILVMATPMTLKREKYKTLLERFDREAEFIPLACPGLAARIEKGSLDAEDLEKMLEGLLGGYAGQTDGVVLGCTHYPFVKDKIGKVLGDIPFFDGLEGTAKELMRRLKKEGLLTERKTEGTVVFDSSDKSPDEIGLYRKFFNIAI